MRPAHQLRPLLPLQLKFSATIPMKIAADARAHFIATVITLMTSQFIRTMPSLHFPCFCVFSSFLRIALLNATSSSHGPLSHCPVCLSLIVLFKGRRNVLFALPPTAPLEWRVDSSGFHYSVRYQAKTRFSVGIEIKGCHCLMHHLKDFVNVHRIGRVGNG